MRRPRRIDLISLLSGLAAVPLAAVADYLRSIRISGSGYVLNWLDMLGVIKHPLPPTPSVIRFELPTSGNLGTDHERLIGAIGTPEISETGYLAINDEKALALLVALSIALAFIAMVVAVWAEKRREPTLYLSVGFVCGVLAIAQVWLFAGLVAAVIGVAAVLFVRSNHEC